MQSWQGWFLALLTPMLFAAAPRAGADAVATGQALFAERCSLCHDASPARIAKEGPGLAGAAGGPAAAAPGFAYSAALKSAAGKGLVWTDAALDAFLASPSTVVPGTAMPIQTPDASERQALIAYLKTLKSAAGPAVKTAKTSASASSAFGDWRIDYPGRHHQVEVADLPPPYATSSAGAGPRTAPQPPGAAPKVPAGFRITLLASGLTGPRTLTPAPNGDIFVAETAAGQIRVLRLTPDGAHIERNAVFASGLSGPFGVAFSPAGDFVYVATLNTVVRFAYQPGDLTARGPAQVIVSRLSPGTGGHSTRDIAFSADGKRLLVSIGSASNVADGMSARPPVSLDVWQAEHGVGGAWGGEESRANVISFDLNGGDRRVYATGLRNCVGLRVDPATGDPWCTVNERDGLGDNLPPDYFTHVQAGGYYGWPWYYIGDHEDPRLPGARPDLAGKAIVPDLLFQPHSAPLSFSFYASAPGAPNGFGPEYQGDVFIALHGSWNRAQRTGYKVVRVRMKNGRPVGGYEDFVTGFVIDAGDVWGRPVGIAVAKDGALLISEDAGGTLWRVFPARK